VFSEVATKGTGNSMNEIVERYCAVAVWCGLLMAMAAIVLLFL
jgi:hypothetical protein